MTAQHQSSSSSAWIPSPTIARKSMEARLDALSVSVLPSDIVHSIKNFVVLNQSDVPVPRWRRGGMQPLPLGIFRSSMVPEAALVAMSMDVELNEELRGFSVEVSAKIISARSGRTEGVVCDLGVAGISFIEGDLVLWAKTTTGITQATVCADRENAQKVRCHHLMFSIVPGTEMVLYVDGVKVAREALTGRMEFPESTTVAFCRSLERSHVQTCPSYVSTPELEPSCGECHFKKTIAVIPTKGTLGDAKVYDFPLSVHEAHLAFLTGDKLA